MAVSEAFFARGVAETDPELAGAIAKELRRQQDKIELIASENIVSRAVLEAQGSVLTNKYAEGYPGRRYYGGCEYVDIAEQLAIDRVKALFDAEYANGQPHSGAQANAAAYQVAQATFRVDMDKLREQAIAEKPQVIIAGWSAYPRHLDFAAFRSIADEVGALLWTDMA